MDRLAAGCGASDPVFSPCRPSVVRAGSLWNLAYALHLASPWIALSSSAKTCTIKLTSTSLFAASKSTMISPQETRPLTIRDPATRRRGGLAPSVVWLLHILRDRSSGSGNRGNLEEDACSVIAALRAHRRMGRADCGLRHLGAARRFMDDPALLLSGGPLRRSRLARTWHRPRADRGPASALPRARLVAALLAYARTRTARRGGSTIRSRRPTISSATA